MRYEIIHYDGPYLQNCAFFQVSSQKNVIFIKGIQEYCITVDSYGVS